MLVGTDITGHELKPLTTLASAPSMPATTIIIFDSWIVSIWFNILDIPATPTSKIFFDSDLNFVKEFKLRGVPTTILVNKKGEEFARIIGEVNFQDKKFVKWLLKYD